MRCTKNLSPKRGLTCELCCLVPGTYHKVRAGLQTKEKKKKITEVKDGLPNIAPQQENLLNTSPRTKNLLTIQPVRKNRPPKHEMAYWPSLYRLILRNHHRGARWFSNCRLIGSYCLIYLVYTKNLRTFSPRTKSVTEVLTGSLFHLSPYKKSN